MRWTPSRHSAEICGQDAVFRTDITNGFCVFVDRIIWLRSSECATDKFDVRPIASGFLHLRNLHPHGSSHLMRDDNVLYATLLRLSNDHQSLFRRYMASLQ